MGQLALLLQEAERVDVSITDFSHTTAFVTDRRERVLLWETVLGTAAGASKQHCNLCGSRSLQYVASLSETSNWWCCGCSHASRPVVASSDYAQLPFSTAGIPRIPVGATLRGPISRADLDWYIGTLRHGRAPGPDEIPYELLRYAPEELKQSLHACINSILEGNRLPPADWLGGLVRFLPKPGGDALDPSAYRPVCLLNTTYKILSAVINDRLYRLCERHGLLDPSQEGFRRLRCTQRQVQSLHWAIEEAAQSGAPLYVAYLDFENAFNSVDHEACWRWLEELNIPDLDLLRSLYEGAHYEADLPYGRSAPVFLKRGTKQGDILSPLLFGLIFNALLTGLRQSGVGHSTISGLRPASRGFADDLALCTATPGGMQALLNAISRFCSWSGMKVKLTKSIITAFDFGKRCNLPTDCIHYEGAALVSLPADESFRYLGVRAALTSRIGRRSGHAPCTRDEIHHVISATKALKIEIAEHDLPLPLMVPSMRMISAARFRYSAALVPWTDAELEDLFTVWLQVERATWRLQRSFPSAQFCLPHTCGGVPLEHPRVVLIQALSTHVRQLVALPDSLRDSTTRRYHKLCSNCGCLNERELARYLAAEKSPRRCPIARLLRACGQMQIDIKLPDCLTQWKTKREISWFALLDHLQSKVAREDALDQQDLACISQHWRKIQRMMRGRGVLFPRQLFLRASDEPARWLLPEQMRNNPEWLEPLRRQLNRIDGGMLFPKLDRGLNVQDPQPHQDLVAEILASDRCLGNHQRPLLEVFSDPRWAQVRSTSPLACWDRALTRNGIQPQRIADLGRGQMIVRIFTKIGRENGNDERKRHLCLWLAPSLYTVSDPATVDKVGDLFSIMEPLNRDFVALESRASEMDEAARQVGSHQLFTGKGVIRVEDESRNHLGSVTW